MLSRWMVFIDPPAHTRLRRLVGKAFTPKLMAAMRSDIGVIAGQLLDAALVHDAFDVIADFSYPLPVLVRSEEHTSELQSLMRISYAVFCLKKKHRQQQPRVHAPTLTRRTPRQ